jgi:hypothetical protein
VVGGGVGARVDGVRMYTEEEGFGSGDGQRRGVPTRGEGSREVFKISDSGAAMAEKQSDCPFALWFRVCRPKMRQVDSPIRAAEVKGGPQRLLD